MLQCQQQELHTIQVKLGQEPERHTVVSFSAPSRASDDVAVVGRATSTATGTGDSLLARRLQFAVRR